MTSINISKVIFKKIAKVQETSEIEIYRQFLNHITDFRLDVGILTRDMINDLYGEEDKNPKYFDYRNHCNWSALANGVMNDDECLCFYQEKKNCLIKIFDDSILKKLFHLTNPLTKHIFIISKRDNKLSIYYTTNALNSDVFSYKSEKNFLGGGVIKNIHLGQVLNDVIRQVYDSPTRLRNECTFGELTNSSASFNHIKAPVLMVSHSGSKIDWKHSNKNNEKVQNYFTILSSYNEQNQNDPIIVCLCMDSDNYTIVGYTPSSVMRNQILKQFDKPPGRNPDVQEFMKDAAVKPQGKRSVKMQFKCDKKLEEIDEWLSEHGRICKCDCCKISESYSQNVGLNGPQKLVKIDLDTKEYLKYFNLYNHTNIENLRQVYQLSIASLDIESYTREISRRARAKQKLPNISSIGRATAVEGVQEIALIGYGDDFSGEKMSHYELFRVNKENETKNVVSKMMDHITERQKNFEKKKS